MNRKQGVCAGVLVLALGVVGVGLASDNSGEYSGGFVMPGSLAGVNPVHHPEIFGSSRDVAMPKPRTYCFVHDPGVGWYVDCNRANGALALVHPAKPKVKVVKLPKPAAVRKQPLQLSPEPIDPRVAGTY